MENIFDWEFYVNYNKDLNEINNEEKAWDHYIRFGRKEDRLYKKSNLFDWKFYVKHYKDLNGINNENHALLHYFNHGIKEGRIFNNTMNYQGYNIELLTDNSYIGVNDIFKYIDKYSANNYKDFIYRHNYDNFYSLFIKRNHIDVDFYFYSKVNNIESQKNIIDHFHNFGLSGLIYHPKQLKNIYHDIKILKNKNIINIIYKNQVIEISKFVENKVYKKTFYQLSKKIIKNIEYNLNNNSLLILVFIGNIYIGDKLIDKIIEYKKLEPNFNVSFCINYKCNTDNLKNKIRTNFENYAIYVCKEMGNDIVPTMLMYNNIKKYNSYQHIIKLQTKSCQKTMDDLTDYLLNININDLLSLKKTNCNCISNNKYIMKIKDDIFNLELLYKFNNNINFENFFAIGTIFYSDSMVFDAVLDFMKNNDYYAYLLNNMYDNNRVVYKKSYVHFLERLFGIIKI
jgi:hypothetical protein